MATLPPDKFIGLRFLGLLLRLNRALRRHLLAQFGQPLLLLFFCQGLDLKHIICFRGKCILSYDIERTSSVDSSN